jgi:hypothetical protein
MLYLLGKKIIWGIAEVLSPQIAIFQSATFAEDPQI